jgi:hypothetical protein
VTFHDRLSLKVIAIGAGVGVGLGMLYAALLGAIWSALGFPAAPTGLLTVLGMPMLGLVFTALGGAVAARRARERAIVHAAAVGAVMVVVNAVLALLMSLLIASLPIEVEASSAPAWYIVLSYTLTVPAAVLGGWIVAARSRLSVAA